MHVNDTLAGSSRDDHAARTAKLEVARRVEMSIGPESAAARAATCLLFTHQLSDSCVVRVASAADAQRTWWSGLAKRARESKTSTRESRFFEKSRNYYYTTMTLIILANCEALLAI